MRGFIRHPSDIPIEYQTDAGNGTGSGWEYLNDIGHGGLSFSSLCELPVGTTIIIRISQLQPVFEVEGRVAWSRPESGRFVTGVSFLEADDRFRVRMVEQICYIGRYKSEVLATQGRVLTCEQAAQEWISRYAGSFPLMDDAE